MFEGRTPIALRVPSEQQLVVEWAPFAYTIAADYYLAGSDAADAKQEALVGLLEGLRSYRPGTGVPLRAFLGMTVRRQLIDAVKASRRMKHGPLTTAQRVTAIGDGTTVDSVDLVDDPLSDPHRDLVGRIELRETLDVIGRMTLLEQRAVVGYACGLTYAELDESGKQVDNALQRARRKLAA